MVALSYKKTNHFNSLVYNYLNQESSTKNLYNLYPTKKNITRQAKNKLATYKNRAVLVSVLSSQNKILELSAKQKQNLKYLEEENCVTITTGHQLNILTGPIYFIYKILQTIKLCDELNTPQKKITYVPIFWMATEDHDWQEINHFSYKQEKFEWKINQTGCVGEIDTNGINVLFKRFFEKLEEKKYKNNLVDLITQVYLNKNQTLADATRGLVHELFKAYGLLILDGNDGELKKLAIPYFKDEIKNETVLENINKTNSLISKKERQAHAREINLFYKDKNIRERIIKKDGLYVINNHQELVFSSSQINELIETEPEKFSPNVLMRPLYQEIVLPNVAYIGGGGEISYWLQLKLYFDSQKVTFPIIIPRNSILLLNKKQEQKLKKLNISWEELFLSTEQLINKKVKEQSVLKINFKQHRNKIENLYLLFSKKAEKTEKTFSNLVEAQKVRQLNALDALEKRLLKAEKIKYIETVNKVKEIKSALFPNNSLQERSLNFSELYLDYGSELINTLYETINPVEFDFNVKILD